MGDLGDYWRDKKEYEKTLERDETPKEIAEGIRRRVKWMNRLRCTIRESGAELEEKSDLHWVISNAITTVDFWPTTGLFICRKSKYRKHDVDNLIKFLRVNKPKKTSRKKKPRAFFKTILEELYPWLDIEGREKFREILEREGYETHYGDSSLAPVDPDRAKILLLNGEAFQHSRNGKELRR